VSRVHVVDDHCDDVNVKKIDDDDEEEDQQVENKCIRSFVALARGMEFVVCVVYLSN